jgi:hypothetical protein
MKHFWIAAASFSGGISILMVITSNTLKAYLILKKNSWFDVESRGNFLDSIHVWRSSAY